MRLEDQNESTNVEDRRGGGIGRGGLGVVGVVIALVISYFSGIDPGTVLNVMNGVANNTQTHSAPAHKPPAGDDKARFVSKVLASTETVWGEVFRQGGKTYVDPKLVLFTGRTPTACGTGQAAMGPFYCPGDQKVYIDLAVLQRPARPLPCAG